MLKRILTVIVVSCFLPVMVHAANWSLTTWARNSGGTIQVGNDAARTNLQGQLTTTFDYATTPAATVTVAPNTGYVVSQVILNGVTLTNPTQTTFDVSGPTAQSVQVYFALQKFSITSSVAGNTGGTVSPLSITGLTYNVALTVAKTVTFTPTSAAFTLSSFTGIPVGVTPAAYQTPAVPAAGQAVKVTFPVGFKFTSDVVLVGAFNSLNPIAKAVSSAPAYATKTVMLDGSGSQVYADTVYSWAQTSGPTITLSNAAAPQASFIPTSAGIYTFSLTLTGGSTASTRVTVYADANGYVLDNCQNCHNSSSNSIILIPYQKWTTSKHQLSYILCANCHIGADTGGHPGTIKTNVCFNCHNSNNYPIKITSAHNNTTGLTNSCTGCHDPHLATVTCNSCHGYPPTTLSVALSGHAGTHPSSTGCASCHGAGAGSNSSHRNGTVELAISGTPHFNSITSGTYPASYMSSKADCSNCHNSNSNNLSIRQQWGASGHANTTAVPWSGKDFKTQNECVRCHTTTGFIAYSTAKITAAWGVATDKTKEVLTCIGCHSDVAAGVVRSVTPNKPYAAEPTFTNQNVGISNICMDCHTGRNNGTSITSANFGNQAFIAPHYLTAGGSLQGKSGYHFPGRTYTGYTDNSHSRVGAANANGTGSDGACAACHMSAANKHTFSAVSSTNGGIAAITTTICTNCHSTSLSAATLDAKRVAFNGALEVLKAALQGRGFTYSPNYPYFGTASAPKLNWGSGQNGANVMGAAFNYALLLKEPGAYAHNAAYANQLIVDSIDAVFNGGTVTGSIDLALSSLVNAGAITQDQADSMTVFKNGTTCSSCHTNTSGSHPAHLNSGAGCIDCHSATAASNTALVPGSVYHLNGVPDLLAGPGRTFSYSGGICSNISCHNGGSAPWGSNVGHKAALGSGDVLMFTADSSHDATPLSITENCSQCHYDSLVAQHGGNCAMCHSGATPPANALIGSWDKSCQACHTSVHTAMTANHNGIYDGSSSSCDKCHDTSGGYPGPGDNCVRCHSPLYTVAAVGDNQAPTTTADAQSSYVGAASIHLTATDSASGVSQTWYILDGKRWYMRNDVYVSAPATGSKVHSLQFYSTDHAMNIEATQTVTFTVQSLADTTAPTTTSNFNPVADALYKTNQTVTLSASDGGSGVKTTYHKIDSGAFTAGTSFTISGDGWHSFTYYSVDNANNTETVHVSNSFRIDTLAPVTTNSAVNGSTYSYTGSQNFTLTAADSGSGVASTSYQLDGGAWVSGTVILIAAPASGSVLHTIKWYSVDNAGNQEAEKSVTFTVQVPASDAIPPTTASNFNPAVGAIFNTNQTVTLSPSDNNGGSGVKATYYKIDAGAFIQGVSFTVSGNGLHTFSYYSIDNANNIETTHVSNSFRIDTVAPVTTINAVNSTLYTGAQTFTLAQTDNSGSGIASTWYKLDSGTFTSGTSIVVTAPVSGSASHTISWYSLDNAGNQEATKTVTFTVQAPAGSGGGTATLTGLNSSSSTHPYTHFWVNDATDTNLIADGGWSSDDHTTGATFVVPAGVGYILHVEWEIPDYEGGGTGSDSRVVSPLATAPGATVNWNLSI